ncbi:MAG: hypothetical protein AMJ46_10865 [Latescibacteria bacterium DG_63]|nr:MAG: hypothetical protein AMJ46_10865 [Latescibacteria bacterium DG_63]
MSIEKRRYANKALVVGRIGLVRSLGREGISVTLARESGRVFERWSRYCREFVLLPNLVTDEDSAVEVLLRYGRKQEQKPIVFLSAESDVLTFSRHRDKFSELFHVTLPCHDLLLDLIDKGRFARLADAKGLPVPKTLVPQSKEECFEAADEVGYPCVVKPISQRLWHTPEILSRIGLKKALLARNPDDLATLLAQLPPVGGHELIQQYIPGEDSLHHDFHTYIDCSGRVRGSVVGHKLRTFPIHFGQGCYTRFVEEPAVERVCLDALKKLNYTGVANINTKRHAETGKDYILEINPRYSIWGILDSMCGVNLPLLQYCDAVGLDTPNRQPTGHPQRWLWFGADFKAMLRYRRVGELTLRQWVTSYVREKGRIEFHVFAPDDPLPLAAAGWNALLSFCGRAFSYLKRKIKP